MPSNQKNIIIEIETKTNRAVADIKRLNGQINKLQKQEAKFKQTTSQVKQMSRSFASLATHVGRLAVIYGAFEGLTTTVRTFAEFEQSMARLGAISGATATELSQLEEKALALGESTIYSASQVAQGMNSMAMAGLSAEQQLEGIASVLNVATIGMIGLEEASLITVRTMNAFSMEAKHMGMITDVMATGATSSAQTIQQLGNAYEKVGAVATAFGHSLETTTASLMIMADAGRVGSEAGTQLKIVMSRLAGNKEAQKYIEALGISMYDANGKLLPFKDQLVLLKTKLFDLSEEARNVKLSEIFGEEGKASAIILMKNIDLLDDKVNKLNNSFGLADKKAKEMQDTLIGSYKELKSALEGLAIKIGSDLSPALQAIIEDATTFIQNLDDEEIKKFSDSVAGLIKTLGELGGLLIEVAGFVSKVLGNFEELTGVSSGVAIAIGVVAFKMKGLLTLLKFFNPYAIALAIVIEGVAIALAQWEAEISRTNEATKRFNKTVKVMGDVIEDVINASDQLDLVGVTEYMAFIKKGISGATTEIRKYENLIKNLEGGLWVSKADEEQIKAYKNAIGELNKMIANSETALGLLVEKGQELTDQERVALASKKNLTEANKKLAEEIKDVAEAMDKNIESLNKREASLEKTLGSMATKERKFQADKIKLEEELANIRKKFADDRESQVLSYETRISNLKTKGLSDLLQYNDAQKRADEQLAKAKEQIAKGNLVMAGKYLAEYDRLIAISAGEEITHEEKKWTLDEKTKKKKLETITVVDVHRSTTLKEALKDEKNGHDVRISLINALEQKDLEAHNAKIQGKIDEIEMIKAQMRLQQAMLDQIGQMIAMAGGVKFEADLSAFNDAMAVADEQIDKLMGQQRDMKITGDFSDVKDGAKKVEDDIGKDPVEAELKLGVDVGFTEFEKFKDDVERTPLELNAQVDLVEPKEQLNAFTHDVENENIIAPVTTDTSQAIRNDSAMRTQLSRPLPDIHQYIYQHVIPVRKHGGAIYATPKLPRFNDGGHLDSGVGHSRKTGKLGGYGGGDKVKALLEAGEFIIRKEAVKVLGLSRLHTLNEGRLPRYQGGGFIPPIQRFDTGGAVKTPTITSGKTMNLNLNLGGQSFKMITEEDVANSLALYLQRSEF